MVSTKVKLAREGEGWVWSFVAGCVLFGLALIVNIHPIGDGLWYWYGTAVRHHERLYSDLHLNQQPLFVLLTAAFQAVCGTSWLASKVFPALQVVVFCGGLYLLSTFVSWRGWQRGLLLAAAFAMAITTPFYRFDDYHVTTQCFQAFALYGLLVLWKRGSDAGLVPIAAGLGVLCGLATANRVNDGAGLTLACGLALIGLARTSRVKGVVALGAVTTVTLLAVVLLTGDSIRMWWMESIAHASRIKGGTGSILLLPFTFPFRIAGSALKIKGLSLVAGIAAGCWLFWRYPGALTRGRRLRSTADYLVAGYVAVALLFFFYEGTRNLANSKLGEFLTLIAIGLGVWAHVAVGKALLSRSEVRPVAVVFLIPFWALMTAAMTAGIHLPDYESPVAFLLLLAPVALPMWFAHSWQRRGWILLAALIVVAAVPAKVLVPYDWHHYHSDRMFKDRVWYTHPEFGPMYIDRGQLAMMTGLCAAVHGDGGATELLSLPYPYANYFCDVPPWHGYVQTWFDTSSREEIEQLARTLNVAPPRWISYQRQLDVLLVHESSYNNWHPLAQRDLDSSIMAAVTGGRWTVVQRACFGGSDWMLLRTTPPRAGEHSASANDAENDAENCNRTTVGYQDRLFR